MSINEIEKLISESENGIISSRDVSKKGIHRSYLTKMVEMGVLERVGRGLYIRSDFWEDELLILQKKYDRGVFSHETALYLHGFTDRTPSKFTMTFTHGYSTPLLESENIKVKRVIKEKYDIGIVEVNTPFNNVVKAYDIERTLCDIVKGKGADIQIINEAMKKYAAYREKDINKLIDYAEIMHVKPKILRYMEILLW